MRAFFTSTAVLLLASWACTDKGKVPLAPPDIRHELHEPDGPSCPDGASSCRWANWDEEDEAINALWEYFIGWGNPNCEEFAQYAEFIIRKDRLGWYDYDGGPAGWWEQRTFDPDVFSLEELNWYEPFYRNHRGVNVFHEAIHDWYETDDESMPDYWTSVCMDQP